MAAAVAIFAVRLIMVLNAGPGDDLKESTSSLIQSLATANQAYVADNGALPKDLDNPHMVKVLTGQNPYINLKPEQLDSNGFIVDDWGTPLRVSAPSGKTIHIVSAGPDKMFGTVDDISNQ